jgi:mRNA deadenylase 3'-5' endonuclease subunit Ccr4
MKIATWNLLAPHLCRESDLLLCDKLHLDAEYRKRGILKQIVECLPDILCVQEITWKTIGADINLLGYQAHPMQYSPTGKMGNAIFVKTDSDLEIVGSWHEKYEENIQCFQSFDILVKSTGQRFTVVNTHLKSRASASQIRLAQIQQLAQYITANKHPILICGDINDFPDSQVFVEMSKIAPWCLNLTEPPNYSLAIQHNTNIEMRMVDFIFSTVECIFENLSQPLQNPTVMPSDTFPSDHTMQIVQVKFFASF